MAFNFSAKPAAGASDSPAVKRQKTLGGYNSTDNSANHRATAYLSDIDDDDLLSDACVPDTPAKYETQPTQILDRAANPLYMSSPPQLSADVVQVPASSPLQAKQDGSPAMTAPNGLTKPAERGFLPPRPTLASSMAPAGTLYKAPNGITSKPAPVKTYTIPDDDAPTYIGGSSDEEDDKRANIRPSTFAPKSAATSFGSHASSTKPVNGSSKPTFPEPLGPKFAYNVAPKKVQSRPERAKPIEDITLNSIEDEGLRQKVNKLQSVFPRSTLLTIKNALISCKGNVDDAASMLGCQPEEPTIISDDEEEVEVPAQSKKNEFEMKRGLNAPIVSIKDRYASTQAPMARQPVATPAAKPKRKLMQGRRNPSSPGPPPSSPPAASTINEFDSDSGVESESEEDPELEGRVLKYINTCTAEDLVELTNTPLASAELMVEARPFRSLNAARNVAKPTAAKSAKKSTRAPLGDKIVDTAMSMFSGYEAIDSLVTNCEELGKPLAKEMESWGFDVFGTAKEESGELEMTSFEDDEDTMRDSGVGSPSSGAVSVNGDNGEEDVKAVLGKRKRAYTNFLKKPELMAEDCVLKDYQVVGLNWLALMYRRGLSGILADEMGLGKTCQVISLISHLVETGHRGPHLVICPGSTLENWLREFPKFSPRLTVEPYYGAQKDRAEMADSILERRDDINVIVTTYDLAAKKDDNKFLRRLHPDVCVYDEGHYLKNLNSQRYQGLVKIPAKFKLLLTGTPLQNNLQELAALLAFILPEVFQERQEDLNFIFKAKATTRDKSHAALLSAQRIARARSMLTPFVLRRKKTQVLKHLPAKVCRTEYCPILPAQKEIYDGHLDKARERARIRVEGGKLPKSDENNPLMQLRKAAIHPLLFRRHFTDAKIEKMADILRKRLPEQFPSSAKREHLIQEMRNASDYWLHGWCITYQCIASYDIPDLAWMNSGKVDAMIKLVKAYKENGDRVLIFSQFSLVLDILEAVLNSSLISFTRIDGSTKIDERQTLIDNYRDDESITAFLLTTKAGGTGINLMYANKVIIFDGSFNPQDDRQAENRAHRVGQTRDVEVVRLVTTGTIEEQILALGNSKLELDGRVAGDDDGGAGEEAGEKAISKMLLEGTGTADPSSSSAVATETKPMDPPSAGGKRKRSSMLDDLTKMPAGSGKKVNGKLSRVGEEGE